MLRTYAYRYICCMVCHIFTLYNICIAFKAQVSWDEDFAGVLKTPCVSLGKIYMHAWYIITKS